MSTVLTRNNSGRRCHVQPRAPQIDLAGPGRLRTAHVLALCSISHSTLYARLQAGTFPPPDGRDGRINFWLTRTIRALLDDGTTGVASNAN
jgi:predicted DNA-binding transcriptional regulator AlpA